MLFACLCIEKRLDALFCRRKLSSRVIICFLFAVIFNNESKHFRPEGNNFLNTLSFLEWIMQQNDILIVLQVHTHLQDVERNFKRFMFTRLFLCLLISNDVHLRVFFAVDRERTKFKWTICRNFLKIYFRINENEN